MTGVQTCALPIYSAPRSFFSGLLREGEEGFLRSGLVSCTPDTPAAPVAADTLVGPETPVAPATLVLVGISLR